VVGVTGKNGVKTEAMLAAAIAAKESCFIREWCGAVGRRLREKTEEDDGAVGEHVGERDLHSLKIVGGEFGTFDEEDLILVPARDLDQMISG